MYAFAKHDQSGETGLVFGIAVESMRFLRLVCRTLFEEGFLCPKDGQDLSSLVLPSQNVEPVTPPVHRSPDTKRTI